jgi:hypothetical protein
LETESNMIYQVQKNRFYRFTFKSILLSLLFYSGAYAFKDSLQEPFFSTLQDSLVKNYRKCTKDSSEKISIPGILKWKQQIDTFTSSTEYPKIIKIFREESGLDPSSLSPCEIYNWKIEHDRRVSEYDQLLQENIKASAKQKTDSLNVLRDLEDKIKSPFDINGIPFGITKKSLLLLALKKTMIYSKDYGNYVEYSGINIGPMVYTAALFFDVDGKYCRYELEGRNLPLDSLDSRVRPETENLTNYFTKVSGSPPQHIYRVGRFEINQGRLAIAALWITDDKKVYTGYSTYKYLYYAKAIVERN